MRKTEENPEYYEIVIYKKGCFILILTFILLIWIVYNLVSCGPIKNKPICDAYSTGNTNHRPGK